MSTVVARITGNFRLPRFLRRRWVKPLGGVVDGVEMMRPTTPSLPVPDLPAVVVAPAAIQFYALVVYLKHQKYPYWQLGALLPGYKHSLGEAMTATNFLWAGMVQGDFPIGLVDVAIGAWELDPNFVIKAGSWPVCWQGTTAYLPEERFPKPAWQFPSRREIETLVRGGYNVRYPY